jgi:predicted transcriptional regulator
MQRDFPVLEWGRINGILTRIDLLSALADYGEDYSVRSAMHRTFPTAEPGEMVGTALERIQESGISTMAIVLEGRLVGLVSLDQLREFLLIKSTLKGLKSTLKGLSDELEWSDVSAGNARTRRAS